MLVHAHCLLLPLLLLLLCTLTDVSIISTAVNYTCAVQVGASERVKTLPRSEVCATASSHSDSDSD